jgi:peptidoglycan L-alanyl-D-glutamate endopeptidase CwlK
MLNAASVKKLAKVNPDLVKVCERAAAICQQDFQIVQGNRTQAEQNALYAQGRTKPGKIVTWTKASKHIGGRAIDFAALVNGKVNWNTRYYPVIAAAFKQAAQELKIGVEWGGDWKTKDWGHVQLSPKFPASKTPTAGVGWTVADIQAALHKHGFDPGEVDGVLGRDTHSALKAFQRAQGLEETGGPNKPTLDTLARKPTPPVNVAPLATLASLPLTAVAPSLGSAAWAVGFLEALGWTRMQAVALVANLLWESGGRGGKIDWAAHGDNNHSHGAGQWNDRMGRFQALEKIAKDRGTDWTDPETQLRFLDHELHTTERRAAKRLAAAQNLKDAVTAALSYWRPSIPHADKRQAIAAHLEELTNA